jgi:hypothetical protein
MKPNYIYIGMPKAGSTWLYEFLKWHPQCFVPEVKDLYYFDKEYSRGDDWYSKYFEGSDQYKASIDISHDYIFGDGVLERIINNIPDVKIIACFRNPIEKEFSAYLFGRRNGKNDFSFKDGVLSGCLKPEKCLYAALIKPYLEAFGHDRVKIMLYDDLKNHPEKFSREICEFLGIDFLPGYDVSKVVLPASEPRSKLLASFVKDIAVLARRFGSPKVVGKVKSSALVRSILYKPFDGNSKPVIDDEMFDYLSDFFKEDVMELQEIIGRDLTGWLER